MLGHGRKEGVEVFNSFAMSLFDHASNLRPLFSRNKQGSVD